MKNTFTLVRYVASVVICLFIGSGIGAYAQWGPTTNTLPLVAETDFSVSGGDDDYWHSLDMVDGYGNSIVRPTWAIGAGFSNPKDTKSTATKSTFLDATSYAVTPNPIRLDSLRFDDFGTGKGKTAKSEDWGIVFSAGSRSISNRTAVSFSVPGLKDNGRYRVDVEYCNPFAATYLNTSGSNTDPHLTGSYQSQIKIGTNGKGDGAQTTALPSKAGTCLTASISNPANYNNTQGPISNNILRVDVIISQMAAGEAIMIKSIKVYAELDAKLVGETEICAGGEMTPITLVNNFMGCTYQWYKDNRAVSGETNVSISHESGDKINEEHSYYCEIKTPSGMTVKTETHKIKDIECCVDNEGHPASQKLIWLDDFGTFTSASNYWTWDYSNIAEPKKVNHRDGIKWQRSLPAEITPEDATFALVKEDGWCDERYPCPPKHPKAEDGKFSEGYYTVAARVTSYGNQDPGGNDMGWAGYFGDGTEPHNNGYTFAPDHTYMGEDYGAMLYLNIGSEPDALIYGRTIDGLCDRHVTVKCFLNCFSRSQTNPISVYIRITDMESGNSKESPVYTRYANTTNNRYGIAWIPASVSIDLTGTKMKFEIISKSGGVTQNTDGNDLILDDIMIYACAEPSVDMYFDLPTHLEQTKSCLGDDIGLYVEKTRMIETNIGENARYIYQYSLTPDKLDSWKTIAGPIKEIEYKNLSGLIESLNLNSGDKIYFRTVLGTETELNKVDVFNPNEPCGAYSVSKPIELTIDCPVCVEPKDPVISVTGGGVYSRSNKTVQLCKGESVELSTNDITSKDKDGKDYTDFSLTWTKDGTVAGSKVASGTVAKPLTVTYDDATAAGVEYKITVHDNFENETGTKKCDKSETITIIANPEPKTDDITLDPYCETDPARATAFAQSVAHLSAYTIKWYDSEADALADQNEVSAPDVAGAAAQATAYESYFTITDKTTNCVSEPYKYTFTIQAVPADLTTQSVQYLKSTGTTFTNTILKTGIKGGEEATATTYWMGQYPTQQGNITDFSSRVTDPAAPVAQYPDDKTKDEKVYYYVYQVEVVNGFDCASIPTEIEVDILGAPAPNVTDTVYCLNDTPDALTKFATVNDNGTNKNYELVWFNNETDAPTQGSLTPPTISTSASGLFTFYVAQRDVDDPDNISTKRKVNVSVFDVPVPSATTPIHYCVGETPVQLSATQGVTSTYVQADGYKWVTVANGAESTTAPTPTTTTAGEQDFQVIGSYLLVAASQKYCYSEPFDIKVTVSETKAPAAQTVQYIKADVAADGKTFPSLDAATNNPWKTETTEPNFNYYYSVISTSDVKPTSGYTQGVPSPSFDVSALSGNTQELYCYVYREDKSNPKACPSDTIMITIKISDALPPIVKDVYVCEGTTIPDLSAEVALLPGSGKTADAYELIWYGEKDPNTDNTATESHVGESTYPMGNTAVANNASVTKYYYYVTQREKTTGAESTPSKITVNVLPKPVVTPLMVPQQCEGTVDLNNWYQVDNSSECGSPLTPNYTSSTNIVDATGIYPLTVSYPLGYSSPDYIVNSESLCISEEAKIQVIIDKLDSVWIEGDTTVCPGGDVELQAKLKSETHGENDCSYSWIDNKGTTNNHISFVNHYPETYASEADKIYQYTVTVTAGTCEKTSPVHVVKVGNGQVRGTMSVIEPDNAWPTTSFENDMEREFYSCGGQITLKIDYEKTDGEFNWTVNGTAYKTGGEITIDETDVSSDKTYEVTYINKCETKAKILIHTIPLIVEPEVSIDTLCEGEPFSTKLDITCIETPTIQWYLNTNEITGATNATYSVPSVLESNDDGQYSYKVVNRGCTREGDSRYLDVQRYMKVTEFPEPFIVKKNADQTIQLMVEVPETTLNVEIDKIDWVENGVSKQATSSRSYTETGVVADHTYEITLTDNDYCSTSTTATIWVEADLQLKTDLKDTICLGSSAILTIDTTGTGAFRKKGVEPSLTVLRYTQGKKEYVTSELRKNGDMLEMEVSPTDSASYTIEFSYDDQKLEPIVEIVNVIQAIDLKLPPVSTICEGDTIQLGVSDVTPLGTTVSWKPAETIISDVDSDTITAVPTYSQSLNHQYTYTYIVTATNKQCDESKEYKVPVVVDEALVGTPTGPGVICEGDQAKIDASSYEATTYLWTANEDTIGQSATIIVRPKETTKYVVDMTRGVCKATDEYELQVTSLPVITSVDSVGIRDREIVMEPGKGTGVFYYWVDVESSKATDNLVYNLTFAKHVAFVRDENGCQTSMPFEVLAPPVIIPEFFTPNGDGVNDTWVVEVLREVYTEATVKIYDRFGKLMIEYLGGESDGWDGTYNGVPMMSTDYWYVIDIEEIDRQFSGHFTLIRQ